MKITKNNEAGISRRTWSWCFSSAVALGLMAAPLRAQVPEFYIYTTNQTVPTSFTATLAAFNNTSSLGTNVSTFTWYFNTNHLIAGATNYLLNIFNAQATNAGTYTVVISDTHGAVTSIPPMTLTVTNIAFQAPSVQFSTVASFNEFVDGGSPQAGITQGGDGYLYGTTLGGGTTSGGNNGTVFKMSTNGNFAWSVEFNNANGLAPAARLVQAGDGNFYGTTGYGGTKGFGTVFRVTPGGTLTSIYSFDPGQSDGGYPQAPVCVGLDGYLYGTTTTNGGGLGGTVFKMSTNGGSLVWSYSLANSNGIIPLAGLVQGLDGSLYGTAAEGGTSNAGTVFRIGTNEVFSNLYSFTGVFDGANPEGGLVQGLDHQLYGTTSYAGDTNLNEGTIFKITTNGAFTLVLAFEATNGSSPEASLIIAGDGNFYGTANLGGIGAQFSLNNLFPPAYGTIFQLTTNGTLTSLFSFDGNYDGAAPHSSLWQGLDGGLYGTTTEGGTNDLSLSQASYGDGTVFRLGVAPPTIQSAVVKNNTFSFTWNAMPGVPYQAQYKDTLNQSQWINFGGTVVGTNGVAGQSDIIGVTNKARFYRVQLQF